MGYNTYFAGELEVTPPLNEHESSYLYDFAELRHTSTQHGPLDVKPGVFPGGSDPQGGKPEIWCHWVCDEDDKLVWDEEEKTYGHDSWIIWLIEHLFSAQARGFVNAHLSEDQRLAHFTCDHVINGEVNAEGEDSGDLWRILVKNNDVEVQQGRVSYGE